MKLVPMALVAAVALSGAAFSPNENHHFTDHDRVLANTAKGTSYLTEQEQQVYYYLNLARMKPKAFLKEYMIDYYGAGQYTFRRLNYEYFGTLVMELETREPVGPISPKESLYDFAACIAAEQAISGRVTHDRENCKNGWFAECIAYGASDPLNIVLQFLIDEGVPSLGHRKTLLGKYDVAGVAIGPHPEYGTMCAIDLQ